VVRSVQHRPHLRKLDIAPFGVEEHVDVGDHYCRRVSNEAGVGSSSGGAAPIGRHLAFIVAVPKYDVLRFAVRSSSG
jgi:hypothetical protein